VSLVHRIRMRTGDESGFTLVELLVSIAAGTVVLAALFALLNTTLNSTTRTFSQVDASQASSTATENLESELHSACLASGMAPVQSGSDANNLIFVSQYGSSASTAKAATPTPVEHKIVFSSSAGTLTDYTYAATGGGAPTWTFSTTASSSRLLLSHVAANGSTPVFQYFQYSVPTNGGTPYTDSAGNSYEMIQDGINYVPGTTIKPTAAPLTTPLSSTDAGNTAEVLINFTGGPNGGTQVETGLSNIGDNVQDQVVLRMTPPANHAGNGATFTPCA
jgi:prepilin-type N-terminal cleavage/methylation domain-containing protein